MPRYVVRYGSTRAVGLFSCREKDRYERGDRVIARTPRGLEAGDVLAEATRISKRCDLFLAIGSSLVVQPAAMLPVYAKQAGAKLVIINKSETPLDDLADLLIQRSIGETFELAMELMAAREEVRP